MRALGVIPARGGSKRVPRKNLRMLCGKPLIQHTIAAANAATLLTKFVVSTEDEEIRDFAANLGAYIVRRPDELADDKATTGAVLCHALEWMGQDNFDLVVCLHPTSPIRDPAHIDFAIERMTDAEEDTLASACQLPGKTHNNIWAQVDNSWSMTNTAFILNGSIYAIKPKWLLQHKRHVNHLPGLPVAIQIMDRAHSMDIDEEVDLKIAEIFMRQEQNGNT